MRNASPRLPTVVNRNNDILFRLKAVQICLSCHCPPGFFSLGPCRLQIQAHIESFMRLSMTGWSPRRDSRWEFNEHVFLLRRLSMPTDQHKEECEKVGSQCQSWCVFLFFGGGGGKGIEWYLQSQLEMNSIIHAHFLYAFLFPSIKVRLWKKLQKAEMWAKRR